MVRWGRNNEQCAVTCASVQKGAGEETQSCEPEATDKKEKEKTAKGTILFREEAVGERERERERASCTLQRTPGTRHTHRYVYTNYGVYISVRVCPTLYDAALFQQVLVPTCCVHAAMCTQCCVHATDC